MTSTTSPDAEPQGLAELPIPRLLRVLLAITVGFDGALVLYLAIRDFGLTKTGIATLSSTLLLIIAVANLWALLAVWRRWRSWLLATVVGQALVVLLAGYIVMTDFRSAATQFLGVSGLAIVLGTVGLLWIIRLGRHTSGSLSKGAALVAALFPVLGLAQYWLETDYLPRTSRPLVDVSSELKEFGRTGSTIHLMAKVTLHSRNPIEVYVAGTLLRVVAYPSFGTRQPPKPDAIAHGIDFGANYDADFRAQPANAAQSQLLYADDFLAGGSVIPPGGTFDFVRMIDIDAREVAFTRMSVSASFVTERRIKDLRTCYEPKQSFYHGGDFLNEVTKPIEMAGGGHFLCAESEIAPSGVIQELVSEQPVLEIRTILDNPSDPDSEYPQLNAFINPADDTHVDATEGDLRSMGEKLDDANPTLTYMNFFAEYVTTENPPATE